MKNQHKPNRVVRRIVSWMRKLRIYPRLFLIFSCILIVSTAFIILFNQTTYSRELERNTIQYQAVLMKNAMYKLLQEKEAVELGVFSVTQNESLLKAVKENGQLQAEKQGQTATQKMKENRRIIEQVMLSARDKMRNVRAMILISGQEQYSVSNNANEFGRPVVRDLNAFYDSAIYKKAAAAGGYPSWLDSVKETPQLFYENEQSRFGIVGCMTLAYQLYSPKTREPLGVLVCCIEPQRFVEKLSEYSTKDGSNTFILGQAHLLEGIGAGFSAPPFPKNKSEMRDRIFSENEGHFIIESDGRELLVSFCGEPDFPIRMANLTYRDEFLRPAVRMGWINLQFSAAIILIGACVLYITAVSVAYPLQKLIGTMKQVGAGDFNAMYKAESRDEVGILCQEFDHMVSDMKELIDRVYVSETREKELELAEKSAQLNALQMQVNPHFLYNTLDMIRWECIYENSGESPASDMIEKFCDLLRMTIKGDKKKETIAESLLHATTYLDVVNFRHTHKIELHTQMEFDPEEYQIPCLSLQPILENAVRHGFQGENLENRVICIQGRYTPEGNLVLCVSDNGYGMSKEQLNMLREKLKSAEMGTTSIGLRNVDQRCKLCYGEKYGIQIESQEDVGTSVSLMIPAEKNVEMEEERIV